MQTGLLPPGEGIMDATVPSAEKSLMRESAFRNRYDGRAGNGRLRVIAPYCSSACQIGKE
jgi:hypothetical protein